ncbi:MAG: K(+)-transporting ATPase subunit F [Anaerolineae bacterium]|nr:K(+)-transporting ATPase subunit F [Anaerolineae bacterium]
MATLYLMCSVITVGLLVYLVVALFKPEWF